MAGFDHPRREPGVPGVGSEKVAGMDNQRSSTGVLQTPLQFDPDPALAIQRLLESALRAGFGIGGCQVGLARRSPERVRVMAKSFSFNLEVWIVMHSDLRTSARCRVVADALAKGLAAYCTQS